MPPKATTDGRVSAAAHAVRHRADWRDRAACLGMDTELFFPVGTGGAAVAQVSRAKQVCALCLVRIPCLAWALANGEDGGVWGGTTEDERRALRPPRTRRAGQLPVEMPPVSMAQ
jgi:WhiB family transcriptional regulator, redox-sensing transcriptional regulator